MLDVTSSRLTPLLPTLGALALGSLLFSVAGEVAAAAPALAEGKGAGSRPEAVLPEDDPILGPVLTIDGTVVGHDKLRRQVCAGPLGTVPLEVAKLRLFMDEEMKRQLDAGVPREKFEVTDEEMAQIRLETEERIREEYPGGEVEFEDVLPDQAALDRVKVTRLFQKVFLPENPENYPPITIECLRSQENGEQILEQLQKSYEEREPNAKKQAGQMMFDQVILQQVMAYMFDTSTVIEDLEQLPVDVLMRINGRDIKVDTVWKEIKKQVSPQDVRAAKQWIVNMRLLEKDLGKSGNWLSDADAKAAYDAHSDPYKDSIFSMERIATAIKKFPSIRAYREYHRAFESYKKSIAADLVDEKLMGFAAGRTNLVVGQVTVDADVILLSAYDFEKNRWKDNGWADAEKRVEEVMRLLLEEGRDWNEVLERFSEFYDPPISVSQRANPEQLAQQLLNKGRFRNKLRNHLLGHLEESEYSIFLNGTSICDSIFFGMEVGETAQPVKGPRGWYIARLLRRSRPPERAINNMDTYRELLIQDYVTTHLNQHVQELVKKAEVYGL